MQTTAHAPLYLDWTFWAVVVAAVAIVLSQLPPPVHTMLRRARLAVEVYSRIHLSQKVGNPHMQLHFILTNVGGRARRVKAVTLNIRRDGTDIATLSAQGYLQNPNDKSAVLFTSFSLTSKEEWAHIVNFFNPLPRADEKKYKAAELALRADINRKRELPENKERLVEADGRTVQPFVDMFNARFIWHPGEYEARLTVGTNAKSVSVEHKFRFTLFESDSAELSRATDALKLGDGVYWDSGNHAGILVQIVEA